MNIINLESGRGSQEMSFDEDDEDMEDMEDMDDMDDDDMGPEEEPYDYDSLEDEEDSMYGDDRKGYFDKDSDF